MIRCTTLGPMLLICSNPVLPASSARPSENLGYLLSVACVTWRFPDHNHLELVKNSNKKMQDRLSKFIKYWLMVETTWPTIIYLPYPFFFYTSCCSLYSFTQCFKYSTLSILKLPVPYGSQVTSQEGCKILARFLEESRKVFARIVQDSSQDSLQEFLQDISNGG